MLLINRNKTRKDFSPIAANICFKMSFPRNFSCFRGNACVEILMECGVLSKNIWSGKCACVVWEKPFKTAENREFFKNNHFHSPNTIREMEILNNCCIFKMCHTVKDIFNDSEDIKPIESNNRSNISEITENLLLCGAIGIKPDVLKQLNITCVINAAPELPDTPLPEECTIYRRISVNDCRDSNISDYFDEVADLIEKVANDGGRTLVHCMAGISRSATLCIAYLMKHKNMCLKKAVLYVRQRRPIIMPNNGFFHQLIDYEKQLYGDNSMQMVFNEMFHMEMPDIYDKFYRKHTNRYIMRKIC